DHHSAKSYTLSLHDALPICQHLQDSRYWLFARPSREIKPGGRCLRGMKGEQGKALIQRPDALRVWTITDHTRPSVNHTAAVGEQVESTTVSSLARKELGPGEYISLSIKPR